MLINYNIFKNTLLYYLFYNFLLYLNYRSSELKMDKCLTSILTMKFEGVSSDS